MSEVGEEEEDRFAPLRTFVSFVTLACVAGLGVAWALEGGPRDIAAMVVLTALGLLSQFLRSTGVGKTVDLSFLSIVQLASIPVVGPVGSAVVGMVPQLCDPRPFPPLVRVYNGSMLAATGLSGGLVYEAVGGTSNLHQVGALALLLQVGLPLVAADAVQMVVNAGFIAAVVRLDTGRPAKMTFTDMVSSSGLAYLGYGLIAFLFVVLWFPAQVGPFSAILILAPLFVARWVISQYAEEVRSHESALSGLVTAAEIKDPVSRGHGERVAQLAEWMVEPLSMTGSQAAALRFAARLHDVGKVGLPTRVVRRSRSLSPEEVVQFTTHSEAGERLLAEMGFLASSLEVIRHHHERWDGRGYPDGLSGDRIPLGSRVIAVADAFDSLTSDRPGQAAMTVVEALDELRRRAGGQLDGEVVAALARALDRHGWDPQRVSDDELLAMEDYLDHDSPEASDLFAELLHGTADGSGAPEPRAVDLQAPPTPESRT